MNDVAIGCDSVAKQYRLGENVRQRSLRETLAGIGRRPAATRNDSIWALDDVSFELRHGTVLGIIGPNGAGKSTLLKILSRVTKPTRGRIELRGRVGSLLEVGTGFHPELTGRENIYLNGAILGMKRRDIARRFDEIVAFAEIERFLDTPIKRYSSGMYMRLAFSVAAHLEPDILIVDEVLAVGDAAFQKKCLGKMDAEGRLGRTILLVSHSMAAIQRLCQRVLWIDKGRLAGDGPPDRVVRDYLARLSTGRTSQLWPDRASAPGNERVRLHRAVARAGDGSDLFTVQSTIALEFEYWNLIPGTDLHVAVFLHNDDGITILYAEPGKQSEWYGRVLPAGRFRDVCTIPAEFLNESTYQVDVLFLQNDENLVFRHDEALVFDVHDVAERENAWYGRWPGAVRTRVGWQTTLLQEGLGT